MSEGQHIFLSYRSTEADIALKLAASLKNAGVNLWMDRLDIKPGDDWRKALESALNNCAAMIAVLSPGYVTSKYCQRELARADRLLRPVFPVLLGPIAEEDWPLEIERQQYIDFSQWRKEEVYKARLAELVDILEDRFSDQFSIVPDRETQYITNLVARLETQKGLTRHLEHASSADKWLDSTLIRPQPQFARTWTEAVRFTVTESAVTLDRTLPVPGYRSFTCDIYTIMERYPRFVLIGEPGFGKSTTLRHMTLDAIHARQTGDGDAPLPLLLNLAAWDDTMGLKDFVRSNWPLAGDPLRLLANGDVILYLDGLSEITTHRIRKVSLLRKWLASTRAPKMMVVTCRSADYTLDLNLGLPVVRIGDMLPAHIERFATSYLGEEVAPVFMERVVPAGWADRHKYALFEAARNPFLLSALLLVQRSSPHGELPEDRGTLLRLLTRQMWLRRKQEEIRGKVSFEELETALAELACAMIEHDMGVYVTYDFAHEHMGSTALLQAAQSAGFLKVLAGNVRFTYQAQQEYFAALALSRPALVAKLARPRLSRAGGYLADKWDPVAVIHCCLNDDADDTLREIVRVNPFLALMCIASGVNASGQLVEPIIGKLLHFARSPRRDIRLAAASILARINLDLALPVLIEAMRSGSWQVRSAATLSLWQFDVPPLEGLIEVMQGLEHSVEQAATVAIHQLRDESLPSMIKLLGSAQWKLRRSACWGLGELRDRAAVPGLVQMLYDDDTLVSTEAARALGHIRDAVAVPWLVETLAHHNRRVRKAAAQALGEIGEPALPALLDVLDDAGDDVRRLVIEAIKPVHQPQVKMALLALSCDDSAEVRGAAVEALADWLHDEDVVARLVACLDDEALITWNRRPVCDIAADILAGASDETKSVVEKWEMKRDKTHNRAKSASLAKDRLLNMRQQPDSFFDILDEAESVDELEETQPAKVAVTAQPVKNAQEEDTKPLVPYRDILDTLLADIRHKTEWGEREDAAKALREYTRTLRGTKPLGIVERLSALLADRDWVVRWAAVEALACVCDKRAVPDVMKMVHDPNKMVRIASVRSLLEMGDPAATAALLEIAGDRQSLVREAVAEALGVLQGPGAMAALTTLLADADSMVRLAAVGAIGRFKSPEIESLVLLALEDEDDDVRYESARILVHVATETAVTPLILHLSDNKGPYWESQKIADLAAKALERIGTEEARQAVEAWKAQRLARI